MFNFRRLLLIIIFCAAFAAGSASAQSNLTQILDSITNPDGTLFNGTVVITWNGSSASGIGTVSPLSSSTSVYSGALSVFLVPTTTAPSGTYYVVVYNSSNGLVTWSEIWQVPPSLTSLTVSQVRQASTKGSGGGSTGGTQYATLPISISQVTGLSTNLNTLNASVVSLTTQVSTLTTNLSTLTLTDTANGDTLAALGTTVASLSTSLTNLTNTVNSLGAGGSNASFVDSETPGGAENGTNTAFSLAQTPSPAASLSLYRNGLLQMSGVNFSLAGMALTFSAGNIPLSGDLIEAYYRISGSSGAVAIFADGEIPGGSINGTNASFGLAASPNPVTSLRLYKNGVLLSPVNDFTLSGAAITFVTAAIPQIGDTLQASYRH